MLKKKELKNFIKSIAQCNLKKRIVGNEQYKKESEILKSELNNYNNLK